MQEENDVSGKSSPEQDSSLNQEAEGQTPEQESTPAEETQSLPAQPTGVNEMGDGEDERGVPWKNVAMEYKRKMSDLTSELSSLKTSLPTMLQEAVKSISPQTAEKPKYSKEELIRFKNATEDATQRAWAEIELEKVKDLETKGELDRRLSEMESKRRFDQDQMNAYNQVRATFPLCFNPDGSWNLDHPLSQEIGKVYHSHPALSQNPTGLLAAAKMAFSDYVLQQQPQLAKQTKQLKRQIKTLQKQTLVEGSGTPTQAAPETSGDKLYKNFAKSGDIKSLTAFIKERYKDRIKNAYEQSR